MKKFLLGSLVLFLFAFVARAVLTSDPVFPPVLTAFVTEVMAEEQRATDSDSNRIDSGTTTARVVIQEEPVPDEIDRSQLVQRRGQQFRRQNRTQSEFAQNPFDESFQPDSSFGFEPESPSFNAHQKATKPTTEEQKLAQLRKEYSRIATDKAGIMTLEELETEVAKAKTELAELKATRELESAVAKLNGLIKDFPETPAAKKAKELLGQKKAEEAGVIEGVDFDTVTVPRTPAKTPEAPALPE